MLALLLPLVVVDVSLRLLFSIWLITSSGTGSQSSASVEAQREVARECVGVASREAAFTAAIRQDIVPLLHHLRVEV